MKAHFLSLVSQVADRLEANIRAEVWAEWLPGERALSANFQVSRKTMRKALERLQQSGLITTRHGRGHRIVAGSTPTVSAPADASRLEVALLTPDPVETLRPYTALWVNQLASVLADHDLRLKVFPGKKYFSRTPARALQRLVAQNPRHCWILSHTHAPMQRWFAAQGLPCIVTGSCHPGINLPNVDLDHRAVCRHAAGVLLRLGHRRLAMLAEDSDRAGDLESEEGFAEGAGAGSGDAKVSFLRHDGTPGHACRLLDRLLARNPQPTALLVVQPLIYITVVTHLAGRGLCVPRDLSVMCRDDDTFLAYVRPEPARYVCGAHTFAKQLLKPVLACAAGGVPLRQSVRIFPAYTPGGSLARSPAGDRDFR